MAEILIVQDEPIFNERICEILSKRGYSAKSVRNSTEAMSFLETNTPSVIIADDMKLLKLSCAFVFMSNSNESRKIAEVLQKGALDYCEKNDGETIIEKTFVWMEIGTSLKNFSTDAGKQKRMIELFKKRCSAFQEAV